MKTPVPLCSTAIALIAMATLASISRAQQETPPARDQAGQPAAIVVETATATATVQSVDPQNRTLTLKMSDGTLQTYKAGKDIVNFDQIKPGDQVNATVVDELAVFIRKAGSPPSAGEGEAIALAPKGAKPGAIMVNTTEVTAKITAVDSQNRTVTLEGPQGQSRIIKVGPNVNLADLKKGDDVVVRYTQGLAIDVQSPGAKQGQ